MKLLTISLLIALFTSMTAEAFEDPSGSLPKLDRLLASDFAEAFRAGDQIKIRRRNCVSSSCSTLLAQFDVVKANRSNAEVTTTIEGRTQPHRVAKVTRMQWQEIQANRARDVIREIESYGQRVVVGDVRMASVTLAVNGEVKTAVAYELDFTAQGSIGSESKHVLKLSPLCRGPGQIVARTIDQGLAGISVLEVVSCRLAN